MPADQMCRLVALGLPPGEAFVAALDAAWRAGDAVMPVDPAAPAAVRDELIDVMRPDVPVDAGIALVIPTSGSTGTPKGVQLTHAALEASARATHARIGLEPSDRWLSCLPWQHIGGLQVMLRSRLLGIPLVVHEQFDVARVAQADASLASLVPTQLMRLLDAGVDLTRFRVILLGGAAAPPALLARAAAAGARVVTTYGMSETSGGCVYDGSPLDGVTVKITDEGRVAVSGPMVMSGYRLRPDLSAQVLVDGWLVTSDLGETGTDGRLHVTGRADDVVVSGGENIAPGAVASALAAHPDLADVAVVGVPDLEWGQRVVAVVVPKPGHAAPSLAQLREWCEESLSAAARPGGLVVVEKIPALLSGKPDRLALAGLAETWRATSQ